VPGSLRVLAEVQNEVLARRATRLAVRDLGNDVAGRLGAVALGSGVAVEVGGVVSDSESREGEDDGSGAHLDGGVG